MGNDILLLASKIEKSFPGTKALDTVDFFVKRGEVHGLVGENGAGKSTLMNIIAGVFPQDSGRLFFDGNEMLVSSPKASQEAGIGIVHQEPNLCAHLSVAENIFIGRLPKTGAGMVDFEKLNKVSVKLLKEFKANIRPEEKVKDLSIAKQQIVEIAKAISLNCKLLILDEPTSSLMDAESQILFKIINQLKKQGISIIYISHKLTEVLNICDRISILRDGRLIDTLEAGNADKDSLVGMMMGRNLGASYPEKSSRIKSEVLRVEGFNSEKNFYNIGFNLHSGEILGFVGLIGSGRTKLMRAICGIDKKNSGKLYIEGVKANIRSYSQAIRLGIGYLTEDRKSQGLFLNMDLSSNVTASSLYRLKKGILLDQVQEKEISEKYVEALNIKAPDVRESVGSLSGGNQQKIMLAKLLSTNPRVIILDEPTRGIDVGAKAEIHKIIRQLADDGAGVILVSSDISEIIGMSDKVIVMHEGFITGVVEKSNMNEQLIMRYASGKTA